MRVFVINMRGEPLMPCSQRKARLLLKDGKAKIHKYNPFTIQLMYPTGETTQDVNVGIDTGAKFVGVAVTSNDKVLVKGEIELRDDISVNITARAVFRRTRRTRKMRYRPARFLNRKRKEGWLPPSVQSKLDATFMWIDKFCGLLPNPVLHIEVGKFCLDKIGSSGIRSDDEFYNNRYYVFARDNYACQVCKKKNKILQVHHILYESLGGTNRVDNLLSVCTDCHTSENHKRGGILFDMMVKRKKVKPYKEPVHMNVIRCRTTKRYPEAMFSFGYETTPKRIKLGLDKTHYNDAIAICDVEAVKENPIQYFCYKQFRKKKRSLHESIPRKGKKYKNVTAKRNVKNVPYRNGTHLNDKVKFNNIVGWVCGFAAGEQSREVVVRDVGGNLVKDPSRKSAVSIDIRRAATLNHNNGWQYHIA